MGIYPYKYARQIWVCTIMSRKTNNEQCDENGRCDHCELADLEKQKEVAFRLEGPPKLEAGEDKEGRRPRVRTPSILISEIGHDLDEVVTGWAQKDDALIKVGINDARRDLEELGNLIVKPDAVEEAENL